jgi:hypothetical protein
MKSERTERKSFKYLVDIRLYFHLSNMNLIDDDLQKWMTTNIQCVHKVRSGFLKIVARKQIELDNAICCRS